MKSKLYIIALAWLGLEMQPVFGQSLGLGVEGGANFANLNGKDVNSYVASRLGFVGGGFLHWGLTQALSLQPEVLYAQKGAKTSDGSLSYQLDYVEIPVLLEISLGLPVIGPGILIGPSFDANVAASGLSNVTPADVGVVGGIQVHFDPVLLSGRYEVGLTNVTSNQNLQNGTFTFLIGFMFT